MTFLSSLPDGFEFNEVDHSYHVDGRRLGSVTQVRDRFGLGPDYSAIQESVLANAAKRGKTLHYLFSWWLEVEGGGEVGLLPDLPSRIIRDFEAIRQVSIEARLVAWQMEQPIASTRLGVAGTPDFWGLAYDAPAILDLKSGMTEGTGFQTAGYSTLKVESLLSTERLADLPKEVLHPKRYCLAVSGGRAKLTEIPGTEDEKDFRAAVRIFNLQQARRQA